MLIKFTGGGRGGGGQVAAYLTDPERVGRDHAPPEVVRGDMDRTRELIDSIERQWSYTHGVLSFALEDAPSDEQQREAMDQFERLAFAGLDAEQFDISWVRHQHTEGGRVELHFVVPRMELTSGKALNIAPPGWESTYAPLRDTLNRENGWARPDDPERAVELQGPPERLREGLRGREGREAVHGYLTALVASEAVTDRASMVQALEGAGLEVPRQGRDYLTVSDPESGERFRMKGRIYEKGWSYDRELDRAAAKEAGEPVGRDRDDERERAAAARGELEAGVRRRAEFHAERYPRDHRGAEREPETAEAVREMVVGGADRDLAGGGELLRLALAPPKPARDDQLHERGADVPGTASRRRSDDLREGGLSVPLHPPAGELDHGSADSLRARLARKVRGFGDRLRERARDLGHRIGGLREHFGSAAEAVERDANALGRDRPETARDREFSAEAARSLGRAEQLNRGLGEAGQRVAQRTAEVTRERERSLDRGYGLSR